MPDGVAPTHYRLSLTIVPERALAMRMGKDPAGASPWYVSSFCSEEAQRDAKSFLTPKVADLPGGPRNLSGALETVSLCIARVATQRPSIVAEFGSAVGR